MARKITTAIFIEDARQVHGDKYDYSKVRYRNNSTKVIIGCRACVTDFKQIPASHKRGRGCPYCAHLQIAHDRSLSLEEFIIKARLVHGDKYDYSEFVYTNNSTKGIITCRDCLTKFEQDASHHSLGAGCPFCFRHKKKVKHTTESFIQDIIRVHGNRYDTSQTIYAAANKLTSVACFEHGLFTRRADRMTTPGEKCPRCIEEDKIKEKRIKTETFIRRSMAVHNNKYDYSMVDYNGVREKVVIRCRDCNTIFKQRPSDHEAGRGCPTCAKESIRMSRTMTQDDFIKRCRIVHNDKYSYEKTKYNGSDDIVVITCLDHGDFNQLATVHLHKEAGCPICVIVISKIEIAWLDYLAVPQEYRHVSLRIDGRLFKLDAYNASTNTIYELYGDYWHGNPKKYDPDEEHPTTYKTYGEMYRKTINREAALKAAGYKLITVWESDFRAALKETAS